MEHRGSRILVLFCTAVISIGVFFFIYANVLNKPTVDPTLTSILQDPSIAKNTKDWVDNIGVKSADDIAYYLKDNKVYIHYGKQEFYLNEGQWNNSDMKKALEKLHLRVFRNKFGKLIVMYGDKEVDQWVQTK